MADLAAYNTYRKASRELINKLTKESLGRKAFERSGKQLGISRRGLLVFDSEEEMVFLFDFAIFEYRKEGVNAVETYAATKRAANPIEKELLDGCLSACTSLFRITSTSPSDNTLVLRDLLSKRADVTLTDVNLSRSALAGLLFFGRLIPLRNLTITSGFMFMFDGDKEKHLLADHRRRPRPTEPNNESARRFVRFFQAYRNYGLPVRFRVGDSG